MNNVATPRGLDQVVTATAISARIERLPFSGWHLKARVLVGSATFFDAFDALSLAQILPVLVPLWKINGPQIGFLISMGYVGQLVGAILFGTLAERIGRVKALSAAIFVFSVMSVLCSLAWDYQSLVIFRTLQGVGLGGEVPIAAVYISEIAKADGRGRFVLLYENIFSIGVVIAGLLGSLIVPRLGWQAMFYIGALPIVLAFILPRAIPESPRWFASKGRLEEADEAMSEIERATELSTGRSLPPISLTPPPVDIGQMTWRDILGPVYLSRTLVVWTIWFSSFLVYYSLATWLPTLYRTVFNVPLEQSLRYGLLANVAILAGSLACAFAVDVIGRKLLFIISLLGAAACLTVLWFFGATSLPEVVTFATIACFFAGSAGLGIYLYTPELYPTKSRAIATALGSAWLRIASMIGPLVVGLFIGEGFQAVFLIFAGVAVFGSIVVAAFAIETTGRTLEDIAG